ncbi:putative GTPase, CobW-like protein [Nitrospina gracilis 3/211]|uniref:Putative GTPase, CobW-like protein n=1 Tax=Nitrospina gracilis (strain 3/211) TaxID=1266370 RepID=M1Z8R8_NITG3|nr:MULTISPECIES: GTP-binding protein [Nitrospina]MCF8722260.1 G3E family GTPase [Nitrospina sp. Nb-3]CCQ89459.1 putative GTPase, CobW-like protein [Nitrospina gracilis 3/211]
MQDKEEKHRELPVTLLAGFLGSGKTTLLNHILTGQHGRRIAVIENEFGEIGIDHDLVVGAEEDLFEMSNGCVCCSIKGDLIETLNRLLARQKQIDYIVIEATGLASPGPIAQAFMVEEDIAQGLKLDGVVTLVDCKHIEMQLEELDVAWEQIAFSNVILLNKTDLVTEDALQRVRKCITGINPTATIHITRHAQVSLEQVLDIGGFDLDRLNFDDDGHDHAHADEDGHYHDAGPRHDDAITSVGITVPGCIDPNRFNIWLQMLYLSEGMDVFRAKGILNVEDSPNRHVFQCVYMMFDTREDRPWGDEPRQNTLLFIGRNLNRERLEAGVQSCIE